MAKKLENKTKQNPKLMQSPLKDGRISLYLEYYLGRSETPVLDADGNQVYYSDGAMAGKPKYKIKHVRRKENLNLYLYANPKDAQEKIQNKNTLALAEKTRYEREQRFLEDREGYKFKRDTSLNFLDFFQQFIDESQHTHSYQSVSLVAFRRFKAFLSEMPRYAAYTTYIRPEQITKDMVKEFADYVSKHGRGRGPVTTFNRFKLVVKRAYEGGLIRKNPCDGITIKRDRNKLTKDILSLDEIKMLINTHYPQENPDVQRAFLLTLFTGIRFCDVKQLTYRNVDYTAKTLKFTQSKTEGHSSHSQVIIPLSQTLLDLIGVMPDGATADSMLFNLPSHASCSKGLATWVRFAGINKHITWHCGRHSFAVNTLSSGANIKTVSSLLGHSSISVTEVYLHVVDSQKAEAINSLGEIGYEVKNPNHKIRSGGKGKN